MGWLLNEILQRICALLVLSFFAVAAIINPHWAARKLTEQLAAALLKQDAA